MDFLPHDLTQLQENIKNRLKSRTGLGQSGVNKYMDAFRKLNVKDSDIENIKSSSDISKYADELYKKYGRSHKVHQNVCLLKKALSVYYFNTFKI